MNFSSFAPDKKIKVATAQIHMSGDIDKNEEKIINAVMKAAEAGCQIILFQEGCLTSYPMEDAVKNKVWVAEKKNTDIK